MNLNAAKGAIILATVCLASAYVEIPEDLKRGKMRQYAACRALFDQTQEAFAVVSEEQGSFKKVCNCSFQTNPPRSGLRITCHFAKEAVIPITFETYQNLGQITYFIVRYRKRGTTDTWQEKRVEVTSSPEARIDLDVGRGNPNVYEVEIYAVQRDNTQTLLLSDEISSVTGRTVLTRNPGTYPIERESEYTQYTQSFSMNFDHITDTSMDISFRTESPDVFKVQYINNGQTIDVDLDANGRATIENLVPETEYVFIISYLRNGEWTEMRRKPVRTMPARSFPIGTYEPTFHYTNQDVTLECPVVADVALQTISWYRGSDADTLELLATYDVESGVTTFPSGRDPKIEVIDGLVLKIKNARPEDAGHYKCRYSILGTGSTWRSPFGPQLVTLYITWETRPGIVSYYLQYRPYGTSDRWQTITLRDTDRPSTIVQQLQPVTKYRFEVYDYTGGIQGDLLDTVIQTTGRVTDEGDLGLPVGGEDPCERYFCGRGRCDPYPEPHCACDYGFRGERCDIAINYCLSNPCLNGGSCNSLPDGYVCQCQSGYSGKDCERERTPCNPNPCQNAGVCVSHTTGYVCRCRRGYGGQRCQLVDRRNPCDSRPCVHGKCSVLGRNYHCECDRRYVGRNCDQTDSAPSILLRCPIEEDVYGPPEVVQWFRVPGQRIYSYDAVNRRRNEGTTAQYRGRLSSPSVGELIIRDSRPSDVGSYQCEVSYDNMKISPSSMNLVQVPLDDTRVTVSWRPSRLYIDHYEVKHRDVAGDDDFVVRQIPRDSRRFTFTNLDPGSIYEIVVLPYTQPGEKNQPIQFTVIPFDTPTTTTATTTTTTPAPSRGDAPPEKNIEEIAVQVYGPASPVEVGSTAYLHCTYPRVDGYKPIIAWKKIDGDRSLFLYNQKMPPAPSRNRITMTNEHQLRINNFQQTDAGTFECSVNFETDVSYKVGAGSVEVAVAEVLEIPPPTNLRYDITGPTTTVLTWQAPRFSGITGYVVRYYPTTRQFGQYERREVTIPRVVLDDLDEGKEYNVEIRASDGRMYSEPLEESFYQAVEKIPAPTNFRSEMLSKTQAWISWNQPESEGITGFKVQYWDISRPAEGNLVEKTVRLNEIVLPNLVDGTEYQVWIRAMKGDSLSPQLSRQFLKTTPEPPNPPPYVQFKDIENDRVTVFWVAPRGWRTTDKYRVAVNSLDDEYPFSKQYPDYAPNMLVVNHLRPGVTYRFTVNTVRDGVLSKPVQGYIKTVGVMALTAPYPDVVTLECETRLPSTIYRVRWYKVDAAERDELILTNVATSRRNESIPNKDNLQFFGRVSASSITTLSISDVRYPNDFGKYKCVASSPGRTGTDLTELVAKYPSNIEPPYRFEFDFVSPTSARITWRHPYPEDITGYAIRYWPTSVRYGPEKRLETALMEAELTDLINGTEYQVEIKAKINNRLSDDSLVGQFINFAEQAKNVKVERLPDGNDLRISWENPPGIDGILFSIRKNRDGRWNEQPPMSPDTTSRRIRYPMNVGENVYFRISTLKNNIPTDVVVEYTEKNKLDVEETKSGTEVLLPESEDRTPKIPYPTPVSNLRLESLGPTTLSAHWDPTPDVFFDYYRVAVTNINNREYENFNVTKSYIEVTRLTPYQTYEVSVSAVRNKVFSFPVTDTVKLGEVNEIVPPVESEPIEENEEIPILPVQVPPPTNLRFFNVMRSRFTISWDSPSDDVTDFEVRYRKAEANTEWYVFTTRGYPTATLRTLKTGTVYEVQVFSLLEDGERSAPVTGTQRTQAASERRVILRQPVVRVIHKTNDSFTLRWVRQNVRHQVAVTPIGGAGRRQTLDVAPGVNTLVIRNLEPGKKHRAIVTAFSSGRRSKPGIVYPTTNPNQPGNLHTTTISSNSFVIRWTEPASTLTTGYRVIYFPTLTNEMEVVEATSNRAEITELEPDTLYTVQVQTKQGNELSSPTTLNVTTKTDSIVAPGNAVSTVTGNDLLIRWTPVPDADSYEVVYYPEDDENTITTQVVDSPASFVRIPNVHPGHYVVEVASVKEDQLSPTRDVSVTMPVKPPRNLRVSDVGNNGLTASWEAPFGINYSPQYDVIALPNSVHTPLQLPSEKRTSERSYTFERLRPNTEYKVQVLTRYGDMKSEPLSTVVTTAPVSRPRNVQSDLGRGVITVRWSPVEEVDHYEVTYFPVGNESDSVAVMVPSDSTFYNFPSPGPGEYEIRVVAVQNDQKGPYTNVLQRAGADSPSNVRFSDVTDDSVVVEWRPPRNRALYEYEVKMTSADDVTQPSVKKTTRQFWEIFTDLKPGTRYIVEVVSVSGDQRSQPASGFVTTGVPVTRVVDALVAEGNRPVTVTWREVPAAESYIVTYYPVGGEPREIRVRGGRNSVTLNDLTPETEYVVEVTTVVKGVQSAPNRISLTTRPVGAPSGIETLPSSETVRVAWTPVENVDHYEVTYYPVTDRRNSVTRIVTSPHYEITGAEPGEYEITVTAVKSDRKSVPTTIVRRIGVEPPSEIQFTDATEDEFVVVWSPSPSRDVTSYVVRVTSPDDLTQPQLVQETTDTYARFADLPFGTEYLVEVIAKSTDQESKPLVGTVSTEVPAPNNVQETLPDEEGSLKIKWNEVPNVNRYEVTYYPVGAEREAITVTGGPTGVILRDLRPGTDYIIEVTSLFDRFTSTPTRIRVTTPLEQPKEPNAQPLTEGDKPSPSSVRITWEDDESIPEYEVKYYNLIRIGDETVHGEEQTVRVPSSDRGIVLSDLLPGSEYVIEIKAVNGPRTSRPQKVTITTPLDQPKRVAADVIGDDEVTITWEHPVGEVTEYVVELVPDDDSEVVKIPVDREKNTVTATGLNPGTVYEVRVVAVNSDRNLESQPGAVTVRTQPSDVKPLNVRTRPEPNGSYTITWQNPANPIQYYRVTWVKTSGSPTEDLRSLEVPGDWNAVTIPQLVPDSEYDIVIQSVTKPSDEPTQHNSIIRRITTDVPGLPDSVTAPDVTDNSVVVQWQVPEQETYLTGYRVEVFPGSSDSPVRVLDVPRNTNRATLTGLRPNTTYVVKVTPHINRKPGLPASQTITTDEIRTVPAPEYVVVPETTSEDVVIEWEPPQYHEYITKYNILVQDETGKIIVDEDLPGDAYTYTITDLEPGTTYNVSIRSYIGDRPSETVEEIATTLPAQPTRVTSSKVLPNQFEVSWAPSEGEVISYLVNVEPENNPSAEGLFFETERPSILIPDVEPDTTYLVEVIAVGPGNLESSPTVIEVTTGSAPLERTPGPEVRPEESVTIVPGQPEIVVTWETRPDQPVRSYQVIYRIQGSDTTKIISVPSGVGEIILSSLEPTQVYDVWVRALLDTGETIPVRITDRQTVTILAPENYNPLTEQPIVAPEDGKVSIIWENLGPSITEYGVTYAKPNSGEERQVVVPGTYSGTLLSGLTPGDEYVVSVIGMRNGREPVVIGNVNVGTSNVVPDETSVSASTPTGQITLHWVTDIDDNEYDKVIGYKIIFDRKCCLGEPEMSIVPGKETDTATIGMLEPNTEYVFTVEATTGDGRNIAIPNVQIVNDVEYPETRLSSSLNVPVITGVDGQGFTATVFWRPPAEGRTPITHYTITYIPLDNEYANALKVIVPKTETSHTITGLAQNTNYRIEVQSTNLPSRIVSDAATATYLTPIESPPADEDTFVEVVPTELVTSVRPSTTSRPSHTVSIRTRPRPSPETTTAMIPEPLRSTERSTTMPRRTRPTPRRTTPRTPLEPTPSGDNIYLTPDNGRITVSWEPFFVEDEAGTYRVVVTRPDRPDEVKESVLPGDVETVTISSLQPDIPYSVHVEAVTDDDDLFLIDVEKTEDELPRRLHPYKWLFRPTITSVEPYGEDATVVHWINPETQPRKVTHYILQFTPRNQTELSQTVKVELPADKKRTSHVITGLTPNQLYTVTLQVANEPTKTRSPTERKDFVTGVATVPETTTRRTIPRYTTRKTATSPRTYTVMTTQTTRFTTRTSASTTPTSRYVTSSRSSILVPSSRPTEQPEPLTTEPDTGGLRATTTQTTTVTPKTEEAGGVDALPTFDGKVIINWTPVTSPVDNYILQWQPRDGSGPERNITVPGDTSWTTLPAPTNRPGYIITIYTENDGDSEPIYDLQLRKSPRGGYHLSYRPAGGDSRTKVTHTATQEVYIPAGRPDIELPETEYTFQPSTDEEDREYVHWLQPIEIPARRVGGRNSVTLRWNPERIDRSRSNRYRVELVPINNPRARTIVTHVPTNAPTNIRGLQPGVSYRLFARYIQNEGDHRSGDLAANFKIPAFTRYGVPVTQRRFGINEVWMKELRSGELLLQWDEFPEATLYTVEYERSPNGTMYGRVRGPEERWIVLPRLEPGHMYTINIYATLRGVLTKIYTVTVRRKITGPAPPSKVEWYNMLGHSVDLSWLPPPTYITGYKLTYRLGLTEDSLRDYVVDLPANVTTYTLSGLIPGETYTIVLQSVRGDEISRPFSFPLTMVIPTVRRIYFQQTDPDVIVIRWPSLPDYVTGYLVRVKQVSPPGPDLVPETELPPDTSEFTINNVRPGKRYEFTIRTMIGDKLSEPVTLQLWILRAESELSRVEQTGTWTVSWTGDPYDVDYWKIEVKPFGSNTPVLVDDKVSRFQTSYQLQNLTPGVEYVIYIYGVKNNISSTPIQIRIPANPGTVIRQQQVTHRSENTYATGPRLIARFLMRKKPDEIQIELFPVSTVDEYIIEYKKTSAPSYTSRGVDIKYGDGKDTAILRHLEPGNSYNIKIIAVKGDERSEMSVNVDTPVRSVIRQPLQPLQNIRRVPDDDPNSNGFYIRWSPPRVPVLYYTVTFNYTEEEEAETRTVTEPEILVPNISEGNAANYVISYTTRDGRTSPKSIMNVSYERSRSSRPNISGLESYFPDYPELEDVEQP